MVDCILIITPVSFPSYLSLV